MVAIILLSIGIGLLVVLISAPVVDAIAARSARQMERTRVSREVRRADHRLHRLASEAFDAMLAESRHATGSSLGDRM